jgi:DNA-binding CsgD family transcriptional regulator
MHAVARVRLRGGLERAPLTRGRNIRLAGAGDGARCLLHGAEKVVFGQTRVPNFQRVHLSELTHRGAISPHVYADLGDAAGAREVIRQAREILKQRPGLGTLPTQLDAVDVRLDTIHTSRAGPTALTTAELRLVPFLPTHLTFPQIAERLSVSRNTAKTQGISIYQKLGVSSRGDAVERLRDLGLLDL